MWLPEPVVAQPAQSLSDDLSVALLLALERLSPLERAAFLLHDVFDMDYADVGTAIDHSEVACRQLASRARENIRQDRPRYRAEDSEARKIADAFVVAAATGNVEGFARLLAEDAVFYSDGGGKRRARVGRGGDPDGVARPVNEGHQARPGGRGRASSRRGLRHRG